MGSNVRLFETTKQQSTDLPAFPHLANEATMSLVKPKPVVSKSRKAGGTNEAKAGVSEK